MPHGHRHNRAVTQGAVAHRLDGWQWTGRQLYPKAAALCFRRAAWILRNLSPADPLCERLKGALNIRTTM